MKLTEKTINSKLLHQGRIISLREDTVELENGHIAKREVVHHNGGVCIAALDTDANVYFVRQFRYPYKAVLLELPAGKREGEEDPLVCGRRELKEETGITAATYTSLGTLYPTPGYVDEVIHMYAATDLTFTTQNLDDDEFLLIQKMPIEQAVNMVLSNQIPDAKTQTALLKIKLLMDNGTLVWKK